MKTIEKEAIVLEVIRSLANLDSKVPEINAGGCGIVAEELYKLLYKFGLKPKIGVITRTSPTIVKKELKNNCGGFDIQFNHIIVYVNGRYIDSTGSRDVGYYAIKYSNTKIVTGMPIKLLKVWNEDIEIWNDTFKRKRDIPKIKEHIKSIEEKLIKLNLVVSK